MLLSQTRLLQRCCAVHSPASQSPAACDTLPGHAFLGYAHSCFGNLLVWTEYCCGIVGHHRLVILLFRPKHQRGRWHDRQGHGARGHGSLRAEEGLCCQTTPAELLPRVGRACPALRCCRRHWRPRASRPAAAPACTWCRTPAAARPRARSRTPRSRRSCAECNAPAVWPVDERDRHGAATRLAGPLIEMCVHLALHMRCCEWHFRWMQQVTRRCQPRGKQLHYALRAHRLPLGNE